jgi:hypothetical protein
VSIGALAWVFDHSQAEGVDRLVLLALANHYHAETGECFPGQRQVAREANCSQATITRAVRRLVELGEVTAVAGVGRATTRYHFPWLSTGPGSDSPRANRNGSRSDSPGRIATGTRSDSRGVRSDSSGTRSDSPRRVESLNRVAKPRAAAARAAKGGGVGAQPKPTAEAATTRDPFTDDRGTFLPGTGWVSR